MKVLMVLEREFPEDERVEKETLSLLKMGYEVHLVCYTLKNRPAKENYKGIHIHRKLISTFLLKKASVAALKMPFYFRFWQQFILAITKKNTFDAIHIHDLPLAKVGYTIAKKNKAKFILDLHENWAGLLAVSQHTQSFLGKILSSNTQWDAYETVYCKKADQVIVVVEEAKERLIKKGVSKDKIIIVSNTISIPLSIKKPMTYDCYTFIYAGGITYHRGLQYVLDGLALLNKITPDWQLVLIGSGSYVKTLENQAKKLKLEHKIHFKGHQSYHKMMEYLAGADCGLIPHIKSSHTDYTIPNKLFQYMYLKKPVLASNCNPIERIVTQNNSGYIYTYNQPKAFCKKALALIKNQPDTHFGENGHQAVLTHYNWQMEEKTLSENYLKMLF